METVMKKLLFISLLLSIAPAAFAMASVADQNDLYQLTYKTISERFQYYLQARYSTRLDKERGRDVHYWAHPAQHRTCGFPAYGAHLG